MARDFEEALKVVDKGGLLSHIKTISRAFTILGPLRVRIVKQLMLVPRLGHSTILEGDLDDLGPFQDVCLHFHLYLTILVSTGTEAVP